MTGQSDLTYGDVLMSLIILKQGAVQEAENYAAVRPTAS